MYLLNYEQFYSLEEKECNVVGDEKAFLVYLLLEKLTIELLSVFVYISLYSGTGLIKSGTV